MKKFEKNDRMWVVPENDLEAVEIVKMLKQNGEDVEVTSQTWGASWENLEDDIKRKLEENESKTKEVDIEVEDNSPLTSDTKGKWELKEGHKGKTVMYGGANIDSTTKNIEGTHKEYLETEEVDPGWDEGDFVKKGDFIRDKKIEHQTVFGGKEVYGVELQGKSPYKHSENIDHHIYGDDDRSNHDSSIEQVAKILGVKLTLDQKFVAANDKGYIPEMEKLGKELGLSNEELDEVISNIRMRDRETQGVTIEQEEQAQEAVDKLGKITEKQELISMDLPHSKTSTVTDRLYGKYDNLLITSADGETNFFGQTDLINMLNDKFKKVDEKGNSNCWSGGQLDQGNGFWGGYADQNAIKKAVGEYVENKEKSEKSMKDNELDLNDEDEWNLDV